MPAHGAEETQILPHDQSVPSKTLVTVMNVWPRQQRLQQEKKTHIGSPNSPDCHQMALASRIDMLDIQGLSKNIQVIKVTWVT